jgi:hypothetical protein
MFPKALVLLRLEIEIARIRNVYWDCVLPREAGMCVRTIQTFRLPLEFRRISGAKSASALGTNNVPGILYSITVLRCAFPTTSQLRSVEILRRG